jgi:hypothetical protein
MLLDGIRSSGLEVNSDELPRKVHDRARSAHLLDRRRVALRRRTTPLN